jgi:hypothetical protein
MHGPRQRGDAARQPSCLTHHPSLSQFQKAHHEWVEIGSSGDIEQPGDQWSESIAVGSEDLLSE